MIPVPFQIWYLRQGGGDPAQQAYVNRVEADGGTIESIGCVPAGVWDWTAPDFVGLLDTYPNAAAAYSLRKLRTAYSGSAVRVRESSGNTEADIGFTAAGELDTTALLAHCGANDGFVVTWYDQSGNANDADNSTAANQPKIVSSGSLVEENGKPAVDFDGVNDYLSSSTSWGINGTVSRSFFIVSKADANSISNSYIGIGDGTTAGNLDKWSISTEMGIRVYGAGIVYGSPSTNQALLTNIFEGTNINQSVGYINGSLSAVTSPGGGIINTDDTFNNIGANGANINFMDGNIQEVIIYASNKTTDRTPIETNINTLYSIYP